MSGPAQHTGAARLAARAGLRIGAGLVRILCPADAVPVIAASITAVMVDAFMTPEALGRLAEPMDAVVIGPAAGVTEETAYNLVALGRTGAALVVDADALTTFKDRPKALFACLDRDDVLTPHEGEFERVFPGLLKHGRETAAWEAARVAGANVILKGRETVIAAPDGRVRVNGNGSPWLATAGSGDVLAGHGRGADRPADGQFRGRLRRCLDAWGCGRALWARPDRGRPGGGVAGRAEGPLSGLSQVGARTPTAFHRKRTNMEHCS